MIGIDGVDGYYSYLTKNIIEANLKTSFRWIDLRWLLWYYFRRQVASASLKDLRDLGWFLWKLILDSVNTGYSNNRLSPPPCELEYILRKGMH